VPRHSVELLAALAGSTYPPARVNRLTLCPGLPCPNPGRSRRRLSELVAQVVLADSMKACQFEVSTAPMNLPDSLKQRHPREMVFPEPDQVCQLPTPRPVAVIVQERVRKVLPRRRAAGSVAHSILAAAPASRARPAPGLPALWACPNLAALPAPPLPPSLLAARGSGPVRSACPNLAALPGSRRHQSLACPAHSILQDPSAAVALFASLPRHCFPAALLPSFSRCCGRGKWQLPG